MPKLGEKISLETREKMSKGHKGKSTWNKGKPLTEEWKRKIGFANSISHKGKKLSEETKRKISIACKGIKRSEEIRRKISIAKTGIKIMGHSCSEEHKQKLSKLFKGRPSPNKGKKFPERGQKILGKNHPRFKGIIKDSGGYILIYSPTHPFCNIHKYVRRSRLVMEKHLGRYLTLEEVVHHINKIHNDDRIENFMLFASNGKHLKFHWNLRKIIHI